MENKSLPTSITFVYGHPKLARRAEVWHQLLALKTKTHPQLICIGDFNQILTREEKFSFTQGRMLGWKDLLGWKQDQLQQIQNSISTIEDVRLERSLRNDLEELLNREELMWAQKARSN